MNNNKLIAEFMGLDSFKDSLASLHQGKINVDVDVYEQAQYHTSGDWLMPVVKKIESLGSVFTIQGGKAEYGEMISETRCFIAEDKLSSTYKAVVEFINEHNKYICGSCDDHVNEVVFNEDADVDECTNCIEYYER